ncbi:hypothetical protein F4811DRAFT_521316, partial [Daldinia bambusicola]
MATCLGPPPQRLPRPPLMITGCSSLFLVALACGVCVCLRMLYAVCQENKDWISSHSEIEMATGGGGSFRYVYNVCSMGRKVVIGGEREKKENSWLTIRIIRFHYQWKTFDRQNSIGGEHFRH